MLHTVTKNISVSTKIWRGEKLQLLIKIISESYTYNTNLNVFYTGVLQSMWLSFRSLLIIVFFQQHIKNSLCFPSRIKTSSYWCYHRQEPSFLTPHDTNTSNFWSDSRSWRWWPLSFIIVMFNDMIVTDFTKNWIC